MWFRDHANCLKYPSINRKDNDGNYTFENCEFIETGLNSAERNKRFLSKSILQFDLNGNFIKEWKSQRDASRKLNISQSNISLVCKNIYYQTHGFIFKNKELYEL